MAEQILIPKRLARALPWLRRLSWRIEASFIRMLIRLIQVAQPETAIGWGIALLKLLGPITPMWDKVQRNLRIAFPELDDTARKLLQRSILSHLGAAVAELVLLKRFWNERDRRLEFIADPAIQALRTPGRPMVCVTAHVGAWQLSNFVAAAYNFPLTSVYAPESNPYLADIAFTLRDALPCTWISRDHSIRRLLEELKRGHSIGLAVDTRLDEGEPVAFFGHAALTNTVPARLALRQGCELVPVRVQRLPGARYRITMQAPIAPTDAAAAPAQQALDMTAQLNARFESWIRETPGEWLCLARRWPKELDKATV